MFYKLVQCTYERIAILITVGIIFIVGLSFIKKHRFSSCNEFTFKYI